MNWIISGLAMLGGICVGIQAAINGQLGKRIGSLEGAFVSFAVGTLALLLVLIFFGKGNILAAMQSPKWQLTGGLLGALYVVVSVIAVPKIGVASTLIAVISGQLLMSAIIDHYGLISSPQIPFDWKRMLAIVLLAAALYLFTKR